MYAVVSEVMHAIKRGAKLRVTTVATTETAAFSASAIMHQYFVARGIGPE
jgi:hypothetical protein